MVIAAYWTPPPNVCGVGQSLMRNGMASGARDGRLSNRRWTMNDNDLPCTCGHDRQAHEAIDGPCLYPECKCSEYERIDDERVNP